MVKTGKPRQRKNRRERKKPDLPTVSVCTPTYNRRPFIQQIISCFLSQDYPKDKIEWIVVDDGTDKVKDLFDGVERVKYYELDEKMSLGKKRNFMHTKATGEMIVYMDDDDYYPPCRISHAVDKLLSTPSALCAGSSEIYIYFKHIQKMYQFGPYGPNHATAGTFAFRRELLDKTSYEDSAALAEEKAFLKNYTIPFVQLDPMKTILVFSHEHNTFDKRRLLENPNPNFVRVSAKTVSMFVKNLDSRRFFMEEIDAKIADYAPGRPEMKPDVLNQLAKMHEERNNVDNQQEGEQKIQECETKDLVNKQREHINMLNSILEQHNEMFAALSNNNKTVALLQKQQADINKMSHELQMYIHKNEILTSELHKRNHEVGIMKSIINKSQEPISSETATNELISHINSLR